MSDSGSPTKWTPEELRRFFQGYHKYGQDFHKVSKVVGGGKAPEICAALWRRHQSYLGLDKKFQNEIAFVALVHDIGSEVNPNRVSGADGMMPFHAGTGAGAGTGTGGGIHTLHPKDDELSDDDDIAAAMFRRGNGGSGGGGGGDNQVKEEEEASLAAEAVVFMASPEKSGQSREGGLAASRIRRTPKKSPTSRGVAASGGGGGGKRNHRKNSTAAGGAGNGAAAEDIYEYYDEGVATTESARKRRQARQRLNFAGTNDFQQQQGKRRGGGGGEDDKSGIDGLLALAEAGEEGGDGDEEELGGGYFDNNNSTHTHTHREKMTVGGSKAGSNKRRSPVRYLDDEEEEEEDDDQDVLGVGVDDDRDEDFVAGRQRRRTPHSTPAKARRIGSGHGTPHRRTSGGGGGGGGGLSSPGGLLQSPGWLGADFHWASPSLGPDALGLSSPGGLGLGAGIGGVGGVGDGGDGIQSQGGGLDGVGSVQHPMPRTRQRKSAPAPHPPHHPLASPFGKQRGGRHPFGGNSALGLLALLPGGGTPQQQEGAEDDKQVTSKFTGVAPAAERRARHALSTHRLRSFCSFEFFYSALDRPWFMDGATIISDLLSHVGLSPGTLLTRKEWAALRSGLGRPRRLSNAFLRESRARLELHRRSVREVYARAHSQEIPGGLGGLESTPPSPLTLPRQIAVGQKVIARHPMTRQLHDGVVLTSTNESYRVQFNKRELGVEVVRDVDVMPLEPWENLPPAMLNIRARIAIGGRMVVHGRPIPVPALPMMTMTTMGGGGGIEDGALRPGMHLHPTTTTTATTTATATTPSHLFPTIDPALMAEIATNLDRKEALLVQLRQMNDEVCMGNHTDGGSGRPNDTFTAAYASVVAKLGEVNEVLAMKMVRMSPLRHHPSHHVVSAGTNGTDGGGEQSQPDGSSSRIPKEVRSQPLTMEVLLQLATDDARDLLTAYRQKMGSSREGEMEEAAKDGKQCVQVGDAHVADSKVGPLIEGAAVTLSLLQLGADSMVPMKGLGMALDRSILKVKPTSVVNAALYTEIETAVSVLKRVLLDASGP